MSMSTAPPSRRGFLHVVGQGALGCALAGCSAPTTGSDLAARDLASPMPGAKDLAAPDLTALDLATQRDLASGPDLSAPPDLACGGIAVPAAFMPSMNEARYWNAHKVFIAQDVAGYMALAPRCAHQGCAVVYMPRADGQAFICPCHGSTFQLDGSLIAGLSPLPLDHVALCWQDQSKQVLLLNPQVLIFDTAQRA